MEEFKETETSKFIETEENQARSTATDRSNHMTAAKRQMTDAVSLELIRDKSVDTPSTPAALR